jgi:hypothetical protein
MKNLLVFVFLLLASCAGGYNDLSEGSIAEDVQAIADEIKTYALEYNATLFHERMKYIDVVWSDSDLGQALYKVATSSTENDNARAFCNMLGDNERVIVLNRGNMGLKSDKERLVILLHEFYHAVSEDCDSTQHTNDIIITQDGTEMPLSLMAATWDTNYFVRNFWEKYKDFYLKTLFGLRLDRIWKE